MDAKVTIPALQQMKRDGRKIVGIVAYDYQMAQIVDRAGMDIVSVGDSVGINLWGQSSEFDVTLDQMILTCQAVRRGVKRALVSCDFPFGPLQEGTDSAVQAAVRIVKEGGADLVKLDGAAAFPDAVRAITRAGIPGMGAVRHHSPYRDAVWRDGEGWPELATEMKDQFVEEAKLLEQAGAALLDFTNSGPVAGPEVDALGPDPGDRRARRRALARRPRACGVCRGRVSGVGYRRPQDGAIRQRRTDRARRDEDVRGRRPRGAANPRRRRPHRDDLRRKFWPRR